MTEIFETSIMNPNFIFIDGSYYCFYRYFAIKKWWKNAYPEESLEVPYLNEKFVNKFKKTFVENLEKISKKFKNKEQYPILIVGKDCKRENIWRNEYFKDYKANRQNGLEDELMGNFFKMVYQEELFQKGGVKAIIKHPKLEADDCIALSVKHLTNKYPLCIINIITSDRDYLQLNDHNVHIYTLSYKNLAEGKTSTGNAKNDLKIKIIMGDSCDNIPSIFPKCGIKTAIKCIENEEYLNKKLNENKTYNEQFILNEKLISFDKIPQEFINEFMESLKVN
jgi:5'-3' exonuclease